MEHKLVPVEPTNEMSASAKSDTPRTDAICVIVHRKAQIALCEPLWTEAVDAHFCRQIERELTAARAEAEALRKDAERYRWLRDGQQYRNIVSIILGAIGEKPEAFDAAIDAARSTEGKK